MILPAQLEGSNGYQDAYFYTDTTTGAMDFFDPSTNCVTTGHSNYCRSELREMTASGDDANWPVSGTNTLSATLAVTQVPDHVCVGQIHVGTGTPVTTKPLLELFYFGSADDAPGGVGGTTPVPGEIVIGIEGSTNGGFSVEKPVAAVPLGTKWSYVIGLTGTGANAVISLSINGGTPLTWPIPGGSAADGFSQEGMYFKAGDYDQTEVGTASAGAKVSFYSLSIYHGP